MRLAAKIEDSLFKVYNDTNMKYKTKYRSMMFNLKVKKFCEINGVDYDVLVRCWHLY